MLELSARGLRIRLTFGFFAVIGLTASLSGAVQSRLLTVLLCSVMHEAGHITAMLAFGIPPETVTFCAGGIALPARELDCPRRKACIILAAGPAVNLASAAVSLLAGQTGSFAAASLALGLFNLMPFRSFDGGRIYACHRGREPSLPVQTAALLPLVLFAAYAVIQGSIPLSLILASLFVLTDIK